MKKKCIAVDLTPILPGGENGGAKVMTVELLQQLQRLAPEWEFILLTSEHTHAELAKLDAPNMSRVCISFTPKGLIKATMVGRVLSVLPLWCKSFLKGLARRIFYQSRARLSKLPSILKLPLKSLIYNVLRRFRRWRYGAHLLKQGHIDLLFCPFTAPFYFTQGVPTICVIYDLQYRYYPDFFTVEEYDHRARVFQEACGTANRLICISEFVRQTVLENTTAIPAAQVDTVRISLSKRLPEVKTAFIQTTLNEMGLQAQYYFLYPANFWSHKNHRMLLVAYSQYRSRYPNSKVKLVCSGAPNKGARELQEAAKQMGIGEWLVLPGYLSNETFSALMQGALAIIYPSLYEGFGMPVLEAMAMQKPVLCSNVTSLPEIAGDAALLFDPRKPSEMADAMARIVNEPATVADLINRGAIRAAAFNHEQMAIEYLQIFREVLQDET
jgi:glycosyltransferase involved in cell wall biosynthesis